MEKHNPNPPIKESHQRHRETELGSDREQKELNYAGEPLRSEPVCQTIAT